MELPALTALFADIASPNPARTWDLNPDPGTVQPQPIVPLVSTLTICFAAGLCRHVSLLHAGGTQAPSEQHFLSAAGACSKPDWSMRHVQPLHCSVGALPSSSSYYMTGREPACAP